MPELLSVADAAERIGVSERTIHRWIREDGLPKLQPSGPHGAIRIDPADLRAFLARDSDDRIAARVHNALRPRVAA